MPGRDWYRGPDADLVRVAAYRLDVAALASAILAGTGQAEEFFEVEGRLERRAPAMTVTSSGAADVGVPSVSSILRVVAGDPTLIVTDSVELAVIRRLDGNNGMAGASLAGVWDGQATPVPLAYASPH